eukprot:6819513-Alexandrium_andersonii.AAC.1
MGSLRAGTRCCHWRNDGEGSQLIPSVPNCDRASRPTHCKPLRSWQSADEPGEGRPKEAWPQNLTKYSPRGMFPQGPGSETRGRFGDSWT